MLFKSSNLTRYSESGYNGRCHKIDTVTFAKPFFILVNIIIEFYKACVDFLLALLLQPFNLVLRQLELFYFINKFIKVCFLEKRKICIIIDLLSYAKLLFET